MDIFDCNSYREYIGAIGNAADKLLLIEFYAEWSIPSQVLSQELDTLDLEFPLIQHIRLNFNSCPVFNK